ncbi:MAG TPA: TonB-dependent receptor [Thermoanaerobaculia bacterium]|nr:TonB-dependent receptor [Thermoanaerobaculia bacterium]
MSRLDRLLPLPSVLASSLALAQGAAVPPPAAAVAADVVVTAEARPEPHQSLGVAATVIEAAELDRSKATALADALRTVPGLDVVRTGGPGAVTSLFLRGTGSTQTLVLVDGVKLNSPFFGGADLSSLGTANLARVEVVRGPFSALYGSEAIGGVVQVLTRRAPEEPFSARVTAAAGNGSAREGTAEAAVRAGAFTVTAGWRRSTSDGTLPNEYFAGTSLSGGVDAALGGGGSLGVVVRRDEGTTGIPFSGSLATPRRLTTAETTTFAVPLAVVLGERTRLDVSFLAARDRPTLSDPDDPYGYTFSETDARRAGGRLVVSHDFGAQRLAGGADYDRSSVTSRDSYGTSLEGATARTWAVFAEDRIALLGERLVLTLGVRHDDHSAFGGATSPRGTLVFFATPAVKLRLAGGAAFRSPTTGELYYPFSGNPDLKPERSRAWEAGVEVALSARLTWEASVFRNDIRDLIQYVPQTLTNENVGRARTQGVETALRGDLGSGLYTRVSYGYLDARDLTTGLALLRRPYHRASATVGRSFAKGGSFEATARFVGSRPDLDAGDFVTRVTMPSYVTIDVAGTLPPLVAHLAPFARLTNLLDRAYAEAAGFPAPGRRFLLGLAAAF